MLSELDPFPQAVVKVLELAPQSLGSPLHPPMPTPHEAEKQVSHFLLTSAPPRGAGNRQAGRGAGRISKVSGG